MKNLTTNMLILASLLDAKYAIKSNMKCTCEHDKCKQMGAHEPGHCNNKSIGKACMYLGPICDECSMFIDSQYILGMDD